MKMSTHGRYGLRFMMDVAEYGQAHPVPLKDVARRQSISMKYLWHIVRLLRQSGLIESRRGIKGGYMLSRPPAEITVADIIMNLEGGCLTVDCVRNVSNCKKSKDCPARGLWCRLEHEWVSSMRRVTLLDLVEGRHVASDYVI